MMTHLPRCFVSFTGLANTISRVILSFGFPRLKLRLSAMNKPPDVNTYLQNLSAGERKVLTTLRQQILKAMPGMEERLSRGVPFFYYRGKRAVGFRASKTHLSFFIMEGNVLHEMRNEVSEYKNGPTVIQFSPEAPLPDRLVEKLVRARVAEIEKSVGKR